jgi:hypothetical protein
MTFIPIYTMQTIFGMPRRRELCRRLRVARKSSRGQQPIDGCTGTSLLFARVCERTRTAACQLFVRHRRSLTSADEHAKQECWRAIGIPQVILRLSRRSGGRGPLRVRRVRVEGRRPRGASPHLHLRGAPQTGSGSECCHRVLPICAEFRHWNRRTEHDRH